MGYRFKWAAALALAATGAAIPAQAQAEARCWNAREMQAEHVRQMQTMLMVAALRCRAAGINMIADYDGFVTAQRDAIANANMVIKQHFANAGGTQADYDRFATSLANGYGDGATTEGSCAEATAFAHEGSASAPDRLERLAAARLFPVALPGGSCDAPAAPMTLAQNEAIEPAPIASPAQAVVFIKREQGGAMWGEHAPAPAAPVAAVATAQAEPLPPLLPLAAPAPIVAEAQPVTLPADVVAAMTVLARYHAAPPAPTAPGQVMVATAR